MVNVAPWWLVIAPGLHGLTSICVLPFLFFFFFFSSFCISRTFSYRKVASNIKPSCDIGDADLNNRQLRRLRWFENRFDEHPCYVRWINKQGERFVKFLCICAFFSPAGDVFSEGRARFVPAFLCFVCLFVCRFFFVKIKNVLSVTGGAVNRVALFLGKNEIVYLLKPFRQHLICASSTTLISFRISAMKCVYFGMLMRLGEINVLLQKGNFWLGKSSGLW